MSLHLIKDAIGAATIPAANKLADNVMLSAVDGINGKRALTEMGNAFRIVDHHGDDLRFDPENNAWLYWHQEGGWRVDTYNRVARGLAALLHKEIYEEARSDLENAPLYLRWSRHSQTEKVINASVNLFKNFDSVRLSASMLDGNTELAGFDSGRQVVDLRTGSVRAALRSDYVTKSLSVSGIGDSAKAVRWRLFLEQIFNGDAELIAWVQMLCGYMMTGKTVEQVLVFAYGFGRNGKSVFGNVLRLILGEYARAVASETLTDTKRTGGAASPDLAELVGARMIMSAETENGAGLAESLIKAVTAGDCIPIRKLYCAPSQFTPVFKLLMLGNHKPIIKGTDLGIWSRILLLPFTQTFSAESRDPDLFDKLKSEAEDITAWMVEGAIKWHQVGLKDLPKTIRAATEDYRTDQDLIGRFLDECCVTSDDTRATATELYQAYTAWNIENGLKSLSAIRLGRQLHERGYTSRKSNGRVIWSGLFIPGTSTPMTAD